MNPGLSIIWLNSCLFEIVKKKRHYNNHLQKCILKHLTKTNLLLIEQYNHTWCVQFILCLITTNMTATRCAVVTVFFMYDTCMVTLSTEVCIKAWNLFTPLNLSISCVYKLQHRAVQKHTAKKKNVSIDVFMSAWNGFTAFPFHFKGQDDLCVLSWVWAGDELNLQVKAWSYCTTDPYFGGFSDKQLN